MEPAPWTTPKKKLIYSRSCKKVPCSLTKQTRARAGERLRGAEIEIPCALFLLSFVGQNTNGSPQFPVERGVRQDEGQAWHGQQRFSRKKNRPRVGCSRHLAVLAPFSARSSSLRRSLKRHLISALYSLQLACNGPSIIGRRS